MSSVIFKLDEHNLGCNLYHAFVTVTGILHQELRRVGLNLTYPQFLILETVFRRPGLNQSELGRETAKDSGAITRSLSYLEKKGFLERKWINGSSKGVFVTSYGEEVKPLLKNAIQKALERACANLTEDQKNCLNCLLQRIKMSATEGK